MRVVFDTNVFISAFLVPGGAADRAFRLARERRFSLVTSVPILTETANAGRRWKSGAKGPKGSSRRSRKGRRKPRGLT
jgi:predicted nucleic acid-binding protein